MSITITCPKRFNETMVHAAKLGKLESFLGALRSVTVFAEDHRHRVFIGSDFSEHSFTFSWQVVRDGDWEHYMNGGLIFHQSDQTWSVHT